MLMGCVSLLVLGFITIIAPPIGIALIVLGLFVGFTQKKTNDYPLPKCPQCGSPAWNILSKYIRERWFGSGPQNWIWAQCPQCGIKARMVFWVGDPLNKKGWYFQ